MLQTFDLAEVRRFTDALAESENRCDNGEGMDCANFDATLLHYANLCCQFRQIVRQWGQAIFTGRVAFDPAVENAFLEAGIQLHSAAITLVGLGHEAEESCYRLDSQTALQAALWKLEQLFQPWVTPTLAVGPAARQGQQLATTADEAKSRLEKLPSLSANWQPMDKQIAVRLKKRLHKRTI